MIICNRCTLYDETICLFIEYYMYCSHVGGICWTNSKVPELFCGDSYEFDKKSCV